MVTEAIAVLWSLQKQTGSHDRSTRLHLLTLVRPSFCVYTRLFPLPGSFP